MTNDRLWAPWRIGYISKFGKEKGCLFCRALRSNNDKKNLVIFRNQHSFAMLNLYPYNNGHIMVSPNSHTAELEDLDKDELADLMQCVIKAKKLLNKTLKPKGFNIGINIGRIAGAGIKNHLHIHIVPRWPGDTNFMPAVFDTKIISQSLEALYKILVSNL